MEETALRVERKIVVVGDGACGKTCLLRTFHDGRFPEDQQYIPTVFDVCIKEVQYCGGTVELGLWDTAGQEDYDRLRIMAYPDADIVLICFSVDVVDSLGNVIEKWLPEVKEMAPNAQTMLVALKIDLRTDSEAIDHIRRIYQRDPLSYEDGKRVSQALNMPYIECSAKKNQHVGDVFSQALSMIVNTNEFTTEKSSSCCAIL